MKTETSHGIKSTDQPARQQINQLNQIKSIEPIKPTNQSTNNCKQTLRNQPNNMPANQLTIEHLQAKQPEVEPTLYTNLPNDK